MPLPADGPVAAGDLLTLEALGHFRRTSTPRGVGLVLHAWGVIAGAVALYLLWPSALTLVAAVLVIGARQLGLMVLMHETAHWLLFREGRLNTWVGTWLCAAPLGVDLKAYRRRHHLHHRHTQTPEDPDLALSAPLPVSRGRLALTLLAALCGWTALTRVARWRPWRDGLAETWRRARASVIANVVLGVVLTALGGWPLYLLAWVLPWATWFQLVTRVRDIAEHGLVHDAADPLRNTRTIGAGLLARAFVAPYGVNYHLEHHLLVFVPCWKLREVQALLLAKGLGGRMERAASYVEVLARSTGGVTWGALALGLALIFHDLRLRVEPATLRSGEQALVDGCGHRALAPALSLEDLGAPPLSGGGRVEIDRALPQRPPILGAGGGRDGEPAAKQREEGEDPDPGDDQSRYSQWPLTSE